MLPRLPCNMILWRHSMILNWLLEDLIIKTLAHTINYSQETINRKLIKLVWPSLVSNLNPKKRTSTNSSKKPDSISIKSRNKLEWCFSILKILLSKILMITIFNYRRLRFYKDRIMFLFKKRALKLLWLRPKLN